MKSLKEMEILEDFIKELVDEFPVGDGVVMKIYVFYQAYIARQVNNKMKDKEKKGKLGIDSLK